MIYLYHRNLLNDIVWCRLTRRFCLEHVEYLRKHLSLHISVGHIGHTIR